MKKIKIKNPKPIAEKHANGSVMDPRQELYLANYLDPKSSTFANSTRSAIKAGYSKEYAKNMASRLRLPKWLTENVNDGYLLKKAEGNLKEFLEMSGKRKIEIGDKEVEVDDPQILKIKQDTTKFTLERLDKNKYSSKTEQKQTGEVIIKIRHFEGEDGDSPSTQL